MKIESDRPPIPKYFPTTFEVPSAAKFDFKLFAIKSVDFGVKINPRESPAAKGSVLELACNEKLPKS